MDALSDVLKSVRLEGAVFVDAEFTEPWCVRGKFGLARARKRLPDAEHVVFQLQGEVEWSTGGERLVLEPEDLLFIPAHTPYQFLNVGRADALFLDVAAKADTWPATITYLEG